MGQQQVDVRNGDGGPQSATSSVLEVSTGHLSETEPQSGNGHATPPMGSDEEESLAVALSERDSERRKTRTLHGDGVERLGTKMRLGATKAMYR